MTERETIIRRWFDMWLGQDCSGIEEIFTEDVTYIESWGPKYESLNAVRHWFKEWNTRGRVLKWEIKQFFHKDCQTVVEWYFKNTLKNGTTEEFDGMSLIIWSDNNKICFLKEYGCNIKNYDPYKNGEIPQFRDENAMWF